MLWLLSPATKGSSILYRRFVHPALIRREAEIDEALARATEQGYTAVLHLGTKGVNYATTVLMQTAIKVRPYVDRTLEGSVSLSFQVPRNFLALSPRDPSIKSKGSRMKGGKIDWDTLYVNVRKKPAVSEEQFHFGNFHVDISCISPII